MTAYSLAVSMQALASRLEVGERPLQLRALLREPSAGIVHLASSKRHHAMHTPSRTPDLPEKRSSYLKGTKHCQLD